MTGLSILDAAIGLVCVYLLLGLPAALLAERVARARALRPAMLRRGIETLLNDRSARRFTDAIYRHPLIASLRQGGRDPAYIPPAQFAKAFLAEAERRFGSSAGEPLPLVLIEAIDHAVDQFDQLKNEIVRRGRELDERVREAQAVRDQFRLRLQTLRRGAAAEPEIASAQSQSAAAEEVMREGVTDRDQFVTTYRGYAGPVERKLAAIAAEQDCYRHVAELMRAGACRSAAELEQHMAELYAHAMARVSGGYKRQAQLVALLCGAVIALAFNAGTIEMAQRFGRDRDVRDAVLRFAGIAAERCARAESPAIDRGICSIASLIESIETRRRLPLGWHADAMPFARASCAINERLRATPVQAPPAACRPDAFDFVLWLLGLLMTAAAVAFAAALWFDLLRRVVTLRATGPPA